MTFVGVILASRETGVEDEDRSSGHRLSVVLALCAAVGFGSYFVLADSAADESSWPPSPGSRWWRAADAARRTLRPWRSPSS